MIEINLLPEEYQRSQRTSPRILGMLLVATVLAFGSLVAAGYLYFNVLSRAQSRVDQAREELDHLMPQVRYSDALEKEKAEFERRSKTIQEIASSRLLWTRKMDRMSEIVNQDLTTRRHQVWLSQIDVDSKIDSRTPGMSLKGYSAGNEIEKVSNFHEDLKTDPVFAEGFVQFTAPNQKLEEADEGVEPSEKIQFDFRIDLPPRDNKKQAPLPTRRS